MFLKDYVKLLAHPFPVIQVPLEPQLLVLEIGTEELPPNDVSSACKQVNIFFSCDFHFVT